MKIPPKSSHLIELPIRENQLALVVSVNTLLSMTFIFLLEKFP